MVSDSTLVRQLKDNDTREQAFRALVSLYKARLYWHIRRTVIDHDDTDDVLQNTFIKIYRNIDKFKEESSLFSWMYRIDINESITFLNAKAKRKGTTALINKRCTVVLPKFLAIGSLFALSV